MLQDLGLREACPEADGTERPDFGIVAHEQEQREAHEQERPVARDAQARTVRDRPEPHRQHEEAGPVMVELGPLALDLQACFRTAGERVRLLEQIADGRAREARRQRGEARGDLRECRPIRAHVGGRRQRRQRRGRE